jgi:hypothetical protein
MSTVQLRVVGRAIAIIIIIAVGAVQADQAVVVADATTITATLKSVFNYHEFI